MNKDTFRQEMLVVRSCLTTKEVEGLSSKIGEQLIELVDWPNVSRIHIYTSNVAWNEVSTTNLLRYIIEYHPHIVMTAGVMSRTALIPNDNYDAIIVPVVAFDRRCQRIGFGGGWYDRLLSQQPQAQKIGLAFESQRINKVPTESHDIGLDIVVTESRTYYRSK